MTAPAQAAIPPLTLLYAPADRPERFEKALKSGTDAVIFDLEDAVAPSAKELARTNLATLFSSAQSGSPQSVAVQTALQNVRVQVRINAVDSPWFEEDLELVASLPSTVGVRIPKSESPAVIGAVAQRVPNRSLYLLLESALGIENAFALATATPQVKGISLGEADLRSQLGITGDRGLEFARSRVVYAAAAAGLEPPAMAVYASVTDAEGLAASCQEGKALGMFGRTAIHPKQLETIRAAFLPTADEIARAQEIVARMQTATQAGSGTVVLADGTFLDAAMVVRAQRLVGISAAHGIAKSATDSAVRPK